MDTSLRLEDVKLGLDLSEATLIDWDMDDCTVRNATFDNAVFTGHAWFTRAHFTGLRDVT
jgi:uncharacterized protein YjbI with pentapeptide repeats